MQGNPAIRVPTNDPLGTMEMLVFNQLHPPFDNPLLRRALLPSIAQGDFIGAIVGALLAVSEIAAELVKKLGLNVTAESMDLGTLTARRNKQDPVAQGGWSCIPVNWNGLYVATPMSSPRSAHGGAG